MWKIVEISEGHIIARFTDLIEAQAFREEFLEYSNQYYFRDLMLIKD